MTTSRLNISFSSGGDSCRECINNYKIRPETKFRIQFVVTVLGNNGLGMKNRITNRGTF